ncbi:MAG: DUF924 family protein [Hyphomicrobiales bacterium]
MSDVTPKDILDFWINAGSKRWYAKSDEFDAEIVSNFRSCHEIARAGGLDGWCETPEGALALIILLDQFPRNMYRCTPDMFAADAKALAIAKEALARGFDAEVPEPLRQFFFMPFMHSEQLEEQERCVSLFTEAGLKDSISYAVDHRDIVAKFGRFPHRNKVLERETSAEEQAFLDDGGFAG